MKEQPQCEVDAAGTKRWRLNGEYHREDGPARECVSGAKRWYLNGKIHREDGPALEGPGGYKEWWLHHKKVHPEQIVDLHLSRGTFCYYDEKANELRFNE